MYICYIYIYTCVYMYIHTYIPAYILYTVARQLCNVKVHKGSVKGARNQTSLDLCTNWLQETWLIVYPTARRDTEQISMCIYIYIYTYLSLSLSLYIYIYIDVLYSLSMYIYIYVYIERERERERETNNT